MSCTSTISVFMSINDFSFSFASCSSHAATIELHDDSCIGTYLKHPIVVIAKRSDSTLGLPVLGGPYYHVRIGVLLRLLIWISIMRL